MARPQSREKLGFYPASHRQLEIALSHLASSSPVPELPYGRGWGHWGRSKVLVWDPFAGQGDALAYIARWVARLPTQTSTPSEKIGGIEESRNADGRTVRYLRAGRIVQAVGFEIDGGRARIAKRRWERGPEVTPADPDQARPLTVTGVEIHHADLSQVHAVHSPSTRETFYPHVGYFNPPYDSIGKRRIAPELIQAALDIAKPTRLICFVPPADADATVRVLHDAGYTNNVVVGRLPKAKPSDSWSMVAILAVYGRTLSDPPDLDATQATGEIPTVAGWLCASHAALDAWSRYAAASNAAPHWMEQVPEVAPATSNETGVWTRDYFRSPYYGAVYPGRLDSTAAYRYESRVLLAYRDATQSADDSEDNADTGADAGSVGTGTGGSDEPVALARWIVQNTAIPRPLARKLAGDWWAEPHLDLDPVLGVSLRYPGLPDPGLLVGSTYITGTLARPAHLTQALSAGLLNGATLTTDAVDATGRPLPDLLIKGFTQTALAVTGTSVGTYRPKRRKGEEEAPVVEVEYATGVEQAQMRLTVFDLQSGSVRKVNMDLDPPQDLTRGAFDLAKINVKDVLVHYQQSLLDQMEARLLTIESLHNDGVSDYQAQDYQAPDLKRPLFPAQANIVRAVVKRQEFYLREHGAAPPGVVIAGEVGSGKTSISLGLIAAMGAKTVLVVCPSHLASTWGAEVATVLGLDRAKVTYIRSTGVMDSDEEQALARRGARVDHGVGANGLATEEEEAAAYSENEVMRRARRWVTAGESDPRIQIGVVTVPSLGQGSRLTSVRGPCPKCGFNHADPPLLHGSKGEEFYLAKGLTTCWGAYLTPDSSDPVSYHLKRLAPMLRNAGAHRVTYQALGLTAPPWLERQKERKAWADNSSVDLWTLLAAPEQSEPNASPLRARLREAAARDGSKAGVGSEPGSDAPTPIRLFGAPPRTERQLAQWLDALAGVVDFTRFSPDTVRAGLLRAMRAVGEAWSTPDDPVGTYGASAPLFGHETMWRFFGGLWSSYADRGLTATQLSEQPYAPSPRLVRDVLGSYTARVTPATFDLVVGALQRLGRIKRPEDPGFATSSIGKLLLQYAANGAPAAVPLSDYVTHRAMLAREREALFAAPTRAALKIARWRSTECGAPVRRLARTDTRDPAQAPDYRYYLLENAYKYFFRRALQSPFATQADRDLIKRLGSQTKKWSAPDLQTLARRWPELVPGSRLLGPRDPDYPKRTQYWTLEDRWVVYAPIFGRRASVPLVDRIVEWRDRLDLTIFDESHAFQSMSSIATASMLKMASLPAFTVLLTGTFSGGNAVQMFPQLWAASPEFRRDYPSATPKSADRFTDAYGYRKWSQTTKHAHEYGIDAGRALHGAPVTGAKIPGVTQGAVGSAPGVDPFVIFNYLLPASVGIIKADMPEIGLPKLTESLEIIEHDPRVDAAYLRMLQQIESLRSTYRQHTAILHQLKPAVRAALDYLDRGFGPRTQDPLKVRPVSKTGQEWTADHPEFFTLDWERERWVIRWPRTTGEGLAMAPAVIAPLWPVGLIAPKEQRLIEIVRAELNPQDPEEPYRRPVIVCYWQAAMEARLTELLTDAGFNVLTLPGDSPHKRAAHITKALREGEASGKPVDVLVVQPRKIDTGLNNLVYFHTMVWFENPNSSATVYRQAIGRIDRPGQTRPTKSIRLAYTQQHPLETWLSTKIRAARNIDALDIDAGLQVLGVGVSAEEASLWASSDAEVGETLHRALVERTEGDGGAGGVSLDRVTPEQRAQILARAASGAPLTDAEARILEAINAETHALDTGIVVVDPNATDENGKIEARPRVFPVDPYWPPVTDAPMANLFRLRRLRYRSATFRRSTPAVNVPLTAPVSPTTPTPTPTPKTERSDMQYLLTLNGRVASDAPVISEPSWDALRTIHEAFRQKAPTWVTEAVEAPDPNAPAGAVPDAALSALHPEMSEPQAAQNARRRGTSGVTLWGTLPWSLGSKDLVYAPEKVRGPRSKAETRLYRAILKACMDRIVEGYSADAVPAYALQGYVGAGFNLTRGLRSLAGATHDGAPVARLVYVPELERKKSPAFAYFVVVAPQFVAFARSVVDTLDMVAKLAGYESGEQMPATDRLLTALGGAWFKATNGTREWLDPHDADQAQVLRISAETAGLPEEFPTKMITLTLSEPAEASRLVEVIPEALRDAVPDDADAARAQAAAPKPAPSKPAPSEPAPSEPEANDTNAHAANAHAANARDADEPIRFYGARLAPATKKNLPKQLPDYLANVAEAVAAKRDEEMVARLPQDPTFYPEARPDGSIFEGYVIAAPSKFRKGVYHTWLITSAYVWLVVITAEKPDALIEATGSRINLAGLPFRKGPAIDTLAGVGKQVIAVSDPGD